MSTIAIEGSPNWRRRRSDHSDRDAEGRIPASHESGVPGRWTLIAEADAMHAASATAPPIVMSWHHDLLPFAPMTRALRRARSRLTGRSRLAVTLTGARRRKQSSTVVARMLHTASCAASEV